MSPRTGRPLTGEEKLDVDVKVRFDKSLNEKLLAYCKRHNISRTEAIRNGVHLLLASEKTENGNADSEE